MTSQDGQPSSTGYEPRPSISDAPNRTEEQPPQQMQQPSIPDATMEDVSYEMKPDSIPIAANIQPQITNFETHEIPMQTIPISNEKNKINAAYPMVNRRNIFQSFTESSESCNKNKDTEIGQNDFRIGASNASQNPLPMASKSDGEKNDCQTSWIRNAPTLSKIDFQSYFIWKHKLQTYLRMLKLERHIIHPLDKIIFASKYSGVSQDKITCDNYIVMAILTESIPEELQMEVITMTTAYNIYHAIESRFEQGLSGQISSLETIWHGLKLHEGYANADQFFAQVAEYANRRRITGIACTEADEVRRILTSLPPSLAYMRTQYSDLFERKQSNKVSIVQAIRTEIQVRISSGITARPLTTERQKPHLKAYVSNGDVKRCDFCRKTNHASDKCFFGPNGKWGKNKKPQMGHRPQIGTGKSSSSQKNDPKDKRNFAGMCKKVENKISELSLSEETKQNKDIDVSYYLHSNQMPIFIDGGCSKHITPHRRALHNYVELPEDERILFETAERGKFTQAIGKGGIKGKIETHKGTIKIFFNEVYFVPNASTTLISEGELLKNNIKIEKTRTTFYTKQNETGKIELELPIKNGIVSAEIELEMPQIIMITKEMDGMIWHHRLGHTNGKYLQKLDLCKDQPNILQKCPSCMQCKSHKLPVNKTSNTRAMKPFERIFSDLMGPMENKTLKGATYVATFIDDKTRWVTAYLLKNKSETLKSFEHFMATCERQHNAKIQILHTDNGGEYCSIEFQNLLNKTGIKHATTCPDTASQNGIAERYNRTVMEGVRTMMHAAKAPKHLWGEAIMAKTYIHNRLPQKPLEFKSAYECLYNREPQINHLRCWGSNAYARKLGNTTKLEPNADKMIIVGFDEVPGTYRVYDPLKRCVFKRRDVQIDERNVLNETQKLILNDEKTPKKNSPMDAIVEIEKWEPKQDIKMKNSTPNADDFNEIKLINKAHCFNEIESLNNANVSLEKNLKRKRENNQGELHKSLLKYEIGMEDPKTLYEAMNCPDAPEWRSAIQAEGFSLAQNGTWTTVDLPKGRKALKTKWVFKRKFHSDGRFDRHKARLVVKGYLQREGQDYFETFSPVVRYSTVRLLLALSCKRKWFVVTLDVSTAFLNGVLEEEIYLEQPEGLPIVPGKVLQLNKALYGLKQAGAAWNATLDQRLKELKFIQSNRDICMYKKGAITLLVYVDDMIFAGADYEEIMSAIKDIRKTFKTSEPEDIKGVLGMKIDYNREAQTVTLSSPRLIKETLEKYGMSETFGVKTPMEAKSDIADIQTTPEKQANDLERMPLRSVAGAILYLALSCRPDLSYVSNYLSRHVDKQDYNAWLIAKRAMKYLKETINLGITYHGKDGIIQPLGYSDANFAREIEDRTSTCGYIIQTGGCTVSWRTLKFAMAHLSTLQAEYHAALECVRELMSVSYMTQEILNETYRGEMGIIPHSNLTADFKEIGIEMPLTVMEDNQGVISVATNNKLYERQKHWSTECHYLRTMVNNKYIKLTYCKSADMLADTLTKPLPRPAFEAIRDRIGMENTVKE
jgi:Reverse transcriptase (RNA-dependent DNA polymerase)/Integrase core domain